MSIEYPTEVIRTPTVALSARWLLQGIGLSTNLLLTVGSPQTSGVHRYVRTRSVTGGLHPAHGRHAVQFSNISPGVLRLLRMLSRPTVMTGS